MLTYFEDYGEQDLQVFYKGPGIEKQIIPANVLYPDKKWPVNVKKSKNGRFKSVNEMDLNREWAINVYGSLGEWQLNWKF